MDDATFRTWYETEHPRVVSALTAITGQPSVAREATDEAFVRAYERWGRISVMASPGGWVYRTALNVARRHLRRRGHEQRLLVRVAGGSSAEAPPPDWSAELWEALRALPRREREAIALRHIGDLPIAEVAAAMGVAVGTASSTLHSARQRLNTELGERPAPSMGTRFPEEATDV